MADQQRIQTILGSLAVFGSAFFFYLATVTIRWSRDSVTIAPAYFVFARLLLGFLVIVMILGIKRRRPRANRYRLLIGRTVANCLAVYCFYRAVEVTTLANANILNMTYPIFIALLTWLFVKEQKDLVGLLMVPVAFAGVWLIIAPAGNQWNVHDLWGLASGVSASFAILFLNLSRRHDNTDTILFYMFGWGTVAIWILFYKQIYLPDSREFFYLFICSAFGVGGQYLLTIGFRFVTAVEGSIISSSRILLAAILGPVLVTDPALTLAGWLGGLLIFGANVVLAVRKVQTVSQKNAL